jgi:glutamyl-tRNA(Gln) amidotransferase subunit E
MTFDPEQNVEDTRERVGYVERRNANPEIYASLGYRCGLEIHQQLKTEKKLFCRCPAAIYQESDDYDAEVTRHMRPTLSELGEYDGTALMEFKTKKNIFYRIKHRTACTYEIDDTPPFKLNREALEIAIEIALLLKTSIVGELHITRKQYLDGSIPTGFQRTGIIGIEGEIPIRSKKIRILQLSIEEDSCREVSDISHDRVYLTDRLGMPLIETVTYPDMKTPDEAEEAGQYLRFLSRSTGRVRTGIGAARQDVNVSITGGVRVEIKGVAHLRAIPELTHNEAFRQKALLEIRDILKKRIPDIKKWKMTHHPLPDSKSNPDRKNLIVAVNLPKFKGILSFFTQPGQLFGDEIHDRLAVIACLKRPCMTHSEIPSPDRNLEDWDRIKQILKSHEDDAQIIIWGPENDISTALETIEERCRLGLEGVPNETRKALKDGTTIFERVLPGPDRMYPDTDSAPVPIDEPLIRKIEKQLPIPVSERIDQMEKWKIPGDTFTYILSKNLFPLISRIIVDFKVEPVLAGTLIGHTLKNIEGCRTAGNPLDYQKVYELFAFIRQNNLQTEIARSLLPVFYQHPEFGFESALKAIKYRNHSEGEILEKIPVLNAEFDSIMTSKLPDARERWLMGRLRPMALGNMELRQVKKHLKGGRS